ncbi:hypothetical protein A3A38_02110 [Candidatus Kaiserbacteria bacterium RIFCSPLOWO2_01_FULL_53_17]|uniref:Uncharacterized protein n=1 Tax=Candidatus Kaiserbacteria bacterium RIFCSPLOWO2_01_FULL_53_17 TaxID=1798511 RepID=A0A1F6EFP8_9BACT|nr:MAG: hypothetical protein A3A38_02110 [Candidatus Kaiserbacteria bacterium RIFCSPLOWO2_01_FULL_53_17]
MYAKVFVTPGAKKEKVEEGKKEGELKISVREPAQRNLANTRVRELLAARFRVPLARVRILSGHHSPRKLFSIDTGSNG